jgi:hypothetical protein
MWVHKDCTLSRLRVEGERVGIVLSGNVSVTYTPMMTDPRYFGIDYGDLGEYRMVGQIDCGDCDETLAEHLNDVELFRVENNLNTGEYENIEWKEDV